MKPICKNLRLAKRNAQKHLCSWIRKNGRFQLWFSVTWCVLTALLVFTFLGWLWVAPPEGQTKQSWLDRFLIIWQIDAPSNNLEIVKVAFTAIGGLGGIVYLVIRYRERTDAEEELIRKEQETADRRLNDAVQQLGSESPQVRIAGVYAIADVADTYLGHYKQRAVDILAGYLRTDRGSKEEGTFKDAAVESTILQIFSDHLKKDRKDSWGKPGTLQSKNGNHKSDQTGNEIKEAHNETQSKPQKQNQVKDGELKKVQVLDEEKLWCECNIDLHGAVIHEKLDFSSVSVAKIILENSRFIGDVQFPDACFSEAARFHRAEFKGAVWFYGTRFKGSAGFDGATFEGPAVFHGARFEDDAWFYGARFEGFAVCSLDGARFKGPAAAFDGAAFEGNAAFDGATFVGAAQFQRAAFVGDAGFNEVTFYEVPLFEDAVFEGVALFSQAKIKDDGAAEFRSLNKEDLKNVASKILRLAE